MTREEQARQWHRRHRKSSVPTLDGTAEVGTVDRRSLSGRVPHPIAAGLWFLFAAILVSPNLDGVARTAGVGFGVLAAPCVTGNTTPGGPTTVSVSVTPTTGVNLTMFNCEGGDFEVFWSGAVNVPDTIYIGLGTTVNIMGEASPIVASDTASNTEASSGISSTGYVGTDDMISMLSTPRGLTSVAMRVAPSDTSGPANESISLGPIFHVDGGELFLENMAIYGGFVTNSTDNPTASGAGIHAQHSSVTATWCEFVDHFAEVEGGGIFAHASTLTVISSVFRHCRAGFQAQAGDEGILSAGGGISSNDTDTFIFGCLFEECYASKKGGGMHQGFGGKMSVLKSVFYNNSAGSNNEKDEAEVGEAGALSISTCELSFDSQGGCSVNDTVFAFNRAARKGGAVNIASGQWPSNVEFHGCTLSNTTTGVNIEDDPQGEGAVLNVAPGNRVLLADSVFEDNYCGNKGGVVSIASGVDWEDEPGATVILRNSTFKSNTADAGNAGVVNLAEFTALVVAGDGNVFEGNTCGDDGGVFGGTTNTNITVEGGVFRDNFADAGGGVVWTKGTIEVQGGLFQNNKAKDIGGVMFSADGSTTLLAGGKFEGNKASDGGVVYAGSGSQLSVSSGEFLDNEASNAGGALFVNDNGMLKITGGTFSENKADFGGFLYNEGEGNVSCVGAVISKSEGVDGGAIYAVDDAVLDWACDLEENTALAGPAIYARDDTTVILRGISLVDNVVARGSVVFVVDDSHLETYQVEFKDTTKSSDISAVQVDDKSSYKAEDTSFVGFQGEAVVFSKGTLYLDGCDFSGSTASQLVYTEPDSIAVIRNTVLGDNNYLSLAKAGSLAVKLPTADSLTNANVTCQDDVNGGDSSSSDSSDPSSICAQGSSCLEGDLGVYCGCYLQRSTMEERCVIGDAAALQVQQRSEPTETFFPDMLEGDLVLSLNKSASSSDMPTPSDTGSSSSNSEGGSDGEGSAVIIHDGSQSGVIWSVSALPQLSESGASMMNWTIFPSSGLLLPGKSVNLRVVTLPSSGFDGRASVTFNAGGMESSEESSTASFGVTFFHCEIGEVWSGTSSSLGGFDEDLTDACKLCSDVVDGETRGVECDEPGATVTALPVDPGYWRASLDTTFIRECSNEVLTSVV